jgi:hypothetical protein
VQEHDGRALTGHNNYIMPFSIAQHIAQGNALPGVEDRRGPAILGSVDGVSPYKAGTTPPNSELNASFPFNRKVYNIVASSEVSLARIASVFVGSGSKVCLQGSVIRRYGFAEATDCGSTTLTGNLNTAGWPV